MQIKNVANFEIHFYIIIDISTLLQYRISHIKPNVQSLVSSLVVICDRFNNYTTNFSGLSRYSHSFVVTIGCCCRNNMYLLHLILNHNGGRNHSLASVISLMTHQSLMSCLQSLYEALCDFQYCSDVTRLFANFDILIRENV